VPALITRRTTAVYTEWRIVSGLRGDPGGDSVSTVFFDIQVTATRTHTVTTVDFRFVTGDVTGGAVFYSVRGR